MRAKNTGSFDHTTKNWRIRGRGIQISVRQLSRRYGQTIPPTERDSRPFWRKYLQELEEQASTTARATSPLQERIRSIEVMIETFRLVGHPTSELESQLRHAIGIPAHDIEHADLPILHPDIVTQLSHSSILDNLDSSEIAVLNKLAMPPHDNHRQSMRKEVTRYVDQLANNPNQRTYHSTRRFLTIFAEICGQSAVEDITVDHYRQFLDITNKQNWSERTKYNALTTLKTFLNRVEADYNCKFGFLRNKSYNRHKPTGQKIQYTDDQIRTALQHATGVARTALLLGLNCGFYAGDIAALTADDVSQDYIIKVREKNKHRASPMQGQWRMWNETSSVIQYGLKRRVLLDEYSKFAKKHNLPSHKALRKTITQLIYDKFDDEASRLYRCEDIAGVHGKSYIKSFTPAQLAKLDAALVFVAKYYNVN